MKSLVGILVLDRPKTFTRCITQLLKMDSEDRKDLTIVVVDNGSNDETKETIKKFEKDVDLVMHHDWNLGYCFGVNSWMSKREPGQTCIQIDQDMIIYSTDWWSKAKIILADEDMGMIAARRPTAWIDRQDKRDFYTRLSFEKRHNIWLEVPEDNILIAPILIYKGSLMDKMGFENEATGYGDLESYYRVKAFGLKSVYIPDIFLYQMTTEDEPCNHPQKMAHYELLRRNAPLHRITISQYLQGKHLFCGTRFIPETMTNNDYRKYSDINFEFHKTYGGGGWK